MAKPINARSRNDGNLFAGMGGLTPRQVRKQKEDEHRDKRQKTREDLLPVASIVLKMIEHEKKIAQLALLRQINVNTTQAQTTHVIAALNMYDMSMDQLKIKLQNMLRDNKVKP